MTLKVLETGEQTPLPKIPLSQRMIMIPIDQQANFNPIFESKARQDAGHNGLALQTDPMFENMQQTGKSSVRIKCIFVSPKMVLSTKRMLLFNTFRGTRLLRQQKRTLHSSQLKEVQ